MVSESRWVAGERKTYDRILTVSVVRSGALVGNDVDCIGSVSRGGKVCKLEQVRTQCVAVTVLAPDDVRDVAGNGHRNNSQIAVVQIKGRQASEDNKPPPGVHLLAEGLQLGTQGGQVEVLLVNISSVKAELCLKHREVSNYSLHKDNSVAPKLQGWVGDAGAGEDQFKADGAEGMDKADKLTTLKKLTK